ncbi:MAG: DUF523 and DUF1722 domain-containing protein [Spirochaetales bacterium]|nr:DUF523 and DUF1722 domain-containing protein [Spirochaetales bacterium]
MAAHPRPRVVVSKCLGFEACRWNGVVIDDPFVAALAPRVEFTALCPEAEIGLGIPRDPVRVALDPDTGERELYQPATGGRHGPAMRAWVAARVAELGDGPDGFLLKNRSPSCGFRDVKVYRGFEPSAGSGIGAGFWGEAVLARWPGHPVEDEGRLRNFTIREHWLRFLWTLTRFRLARESGGIDDLVRFHTAEKLLLLTVNQARMRVLGRVVASHGKRPLAELWAEYEAGLRAAFAAPPKAGAIVNTITHAFGHYSDRLSPQERAHFLSLLEAYRDERVPASAPLKLLESHAIRFDVTYVLGQTFLDPYPEELSMISDSGKGRDL